jgi:hypothetical protein
VDHHGPGELPPDIRVRDQEGLPDPQFLQPTAEEGVEGGPVWLVERAVRLVDEERLAPDAPPFPGERRQAEADERLRPKIEDLQDGRRVHFSPEDKRRLEELGATVPRPKWAEEQDRQRRGMAWRSENFEAGRVGDIAQAIYPGALPDFGDPATLGCVLELVRQAWGDPMISVWHGDPDWPTWYAGRPDRCAGIQHLPGDPGGDSEAEALLRALECAP